MKLLVFACLFFLEPEISKAQDTTKYIARDGSEIKYSAEKLAIKLPLDLKPLFDYPIRDVAICRGPDSTYYLTGTTGNPDMWAVTSDIRVWKSKDLNSWSPVVTKPTSTLNSLERRS